MFDLGERSVRQNHLTQLLIAVAADGRQRSAAGVAFAEFAESVEDLRVAEHFALLSDRVQFVTQWGSAREQ